MTIISSVAAGLPFVCPLCGGSLEANDEAIDSVLACAGCQAPYPVLAGVPILVPEPHVWLARHWDAAIATLAEVGAASADAINIAEAFAAAGTAPQQPFADDWIAGENHTALAAQSPAKYAESLGRFYSQAATDNLVAATTAALGERRGLLVDLGCGSGAMTSALRGDERTVVAADLSLRAALRSAIAGKAHPAVLDAHSLPFADDSIDALVAMNLVDLLDEPQLFLEECQRVLRGDGVVALATPDPALGGDNDSALAELLEELDFTIEYREDHIPWLRPHRMRETQIFFAQLLVAR